jgi:hypothetical protein
MFLLEIPARYLNRLLINAYKDPEASTKNIKHEKAFLANACTVGIVSCILTALYSPKAGMIAAASFLYGRLVVEESFSGALPKKPAAGNVLKQAGAKVIATATKALDYPDLAARPKAWISMDRYVIVYECKFINKLLGQ